MNTHSHTTYDIDKQDWGEYPQVHKSDLVKLGLSDWDIEKLARRIHGLFDWQGITEIEEHAGLKHVLNLWLRANGHENAYISEQYLGNGKYHDNPTSIYRPYWK